jgi:dihydropteroate synthase
MTASTTVADPGRRVLLHSSAALAAGRRSRSERWSPGGALRRSRTGNRDAAGDPPAREWRLRLPSGRELVLGTSVRVMGIVNVTPDSFSDGGETLDPDRATDRALRLLAEGADLIDLGAESTRPGGGSVYGAGAETVSTEEELGRLIPVLRLLRPQTDAPISIDTRKAAVAGAALDEGADLINDVSALGDPEMGRLLATRDDVPVVLMHSRGDLATMQRGIHFDDVVAEVAEELDGALEAAVAAGIAADRTIVDPGIGFGKTVAHNVALLARLDALARLGRPLLVGASRKSFIGQLSGEPRSGRPEAGGQPPQERPAGSLAAAAWACRGGAQILRVHDVAQTVQFLQVWTAIEAAAAADPRSRA